MKIVNKLIDKYISFVDKNETKIVNDFCKKIKESRVGDLTLDEYSRFRFWMVESKPHLKTFFKVFKKDTRDAELDFEKFCEFTWMTMDEYIDEVPKEIKDVMEGLKNGTGAEA